MVVGAESSGSPMGNPMLGIAIAVGLGIAGVLYLRMQFLLLRLLETLRESLRQLIDEVRQERT